MQDIFTYGFMIRALLAGIAIGIIAPLIGTFVVAKRYALIADSLAHVSLAGVAAGILLGIYPLVGALVVSIAAAFIIERLRADPAVEPVFSEYLELDHCEVDYAKGGPTAWWNLAWECSIHHLKKTQGWILGPPDPITGKRRLHPPPTARPRAA